MPIMLIDYYKAIEDSSQKMLEAAEALPMNLGFFGKGNCASLPPRRQACSARSMPVQSAPSRLHPNKVSPYRHPKAGCY